MLTKSTSGGDKVIECLEREGVEVVYGYSGGAAMPIFDALVDSKIKFVLVRHEQGATHMADGYARATGKPGVVLVTSGPGATNCVTGLLTALILSRYPLGRRGGWFIFIGMSAYGVGTILFSLSDILALSIFLMFMVGMGDMLSGVTRQTLIQVETPDAVRGRVLAVHSIVAGTSNELGEFRAGSMAALIGVVPAVLFGGVAAIAASALWMRMFPELRTRATFR